MRAPACEINVRQSHGGDMSIETKDSPRFVRFVRPIVETLKDLGAEAPASEVTARVIARCQISPAELGEVTPAGLPRVRKQIHWARFYLVRAGFLDASTRGVWKLTQTGQRATFDAESIRSMVRAVRAIRTAA